MRGLHSCVMLKSARATLTAASALFLSACFGGGGDDAAEEPAAPVTPPTAVGDIMTSEEASRFLSQATFGPGEEEIDELVAMGVSAWLQAEFAKPQESMLEEVLIREQSGEDVGPDELSEAFWTRAIKSDDQLRQRMGFALSQIMVASFSDAQLAERPIAMANYMDIMSAGGLGDFRQTLENVTYSPAMSIFLTYLQNQKADEEREVVPDENYAREVMQLFTIGLLELEPNGDLRLDGMGQPIETYDNVDVTELAKVFTGLSWAASDNFFSRGETVEAEYLPLVMFEQHHSPEPKNFLGASIPANTPGDESIAMALDALFDHANTPAFISRQLIQRLVTSNPSSAYVGRVADAFRSGSFQLPDGSTAGGGGRGDMRAVAAAILLDPEARDPARINDPAFGKIREPVLRFTHWARAFGVEDTRTEDAEILRNTATPARLNQQAYRSPSVFNFYRPGFVAPGTESAAAGLVAPELQIITGSSITGYANFMEGFVFRNDADANYVADYAEEIALANNPAALVDHLDGILTYGSLRGEARTRIIDAVEAVGGSGAEQAQRRAALAVLMMMNSADYITQR
ncbi:DUF1800 domain-containing protein [Hyphococcus sp.]|uniref:DUF1800 domain-containing protein n=1 Tax=Hyphococcus sp. TaxID=2038636 RepID=UPI003D0F4C6B